MFRFLEKLEALAAAVGMAEGGLLDEATGMANEPRQRTGLHIIRDTQQKQPPRPRPRMRA